MRKILFGIVFFLFAPAAYGQVVTVSFTPAHTGPSFQVQIYRATCPVALVSGSCPTPSADTLIATVTTNTHNDGNVSAGGRYGYRCKTVCISNCSAFTSNESAFSGSAWVTVGGGSGGGGGTTALLPPTNVTAVSSN